MKKNLFFTAMLLLFSFLSCEKQNESSPETNVQSLVYERILALGFNKNDIQEFDTYYLVEGDIVFPKDDIPTASQLKQARTNIVVATEYRNIKVYLNKASFSYAPEFADAIEKALPKAIDAYNQSGCGLTFELTSTYSNADLRIAQKYIAPYVCGIAGFPFSNGRPYNQIYINQRVLNCAKCLSEDQLVFLLVHEIGHCIGLRHTDWLQNGEPADPEGAITIPNTSDDDPNSVMNAGTCCYPWIGFSEGDLIALITMYPAITNHY